MMDFSREQDTSVVLRSDIHTASLGGLRMIGDKLYINPRLPEKWNRLAYCFCWQGQRLKVEIDKDLVTVTNETGTAPVELELCGRQICFTNFAAARI